MLMNSNFIDKEILMEKSKKDDFSKNISVFHELSTHSDVKESKYNPKIFKIQKYVKTGKFENQILSEDELSDEEFFKENTISKKISPFSKVNFSKLRNKEKVQRYYMMRKLVNNLNLKLKNLEKQVTKNPCPLLNKLFKIKMAKMMNNTKDEKNKTKCNSQLVDLQLENLVKAAKKLYFYEDCEFSDEKYILNSLFKIFDNEKININSIHLKKISNIVRNIIKNSKEPKIFKEIYNIINKKTPKKTNLSEEKMNNSDLSLCYSSYGDEEKIRINFKVIDSENNENEGIKLEITKKELEMIKRSKNPSAILKIISNLDDDIIHYENNNSESCEVKLNNKFNQSINNNKLNTIKKNIQNKYYNQKIKDTKNSNIERHSKKKIKIKKLKLNKINISNSQNFQEVKKKDFNQQINTKNLICEDNFEFIQSKENKLPKNKNYSIKNSKFDDINKINTIYSTDNQQNKNSNNQQIPQINPNDESKLNNFNFPYSLLEIMNKKINDYQNLKNSNNQFKFDSYNLHTPQYSIDNFNNNSFSNSNYNEFNDKNKIPFNLNCDNNLQNMNYSINLIFNLIKLNQTINENNYYDNQNINENFLNLKRHRNYEENYSNQNLN